MSSTVDTWVMWFVWTVYVPGMVGMTTWAFWPQIVRWVESGSWGVCQ